MSRFAVGRRIQRSLDLVRSLPKRRLARLLAGGHTVPLRHEEIWLTNASGYRIRVHVHEPDDESPRPVLVLVPDRDQAGSVFCGRPHLVSADEWATRGLRAIHFDPVGRGRSWGHDDFCGEEGQDSLRAVLDFAHSRRATKQGGVGVLSFSCGLALAAPVLAREGNRLGTRFLLDWEGPPDAEAMLQTGPVPPAAQTALNRDPVGFWALRDPMNWIQDLPCNYQRIQSWEDHLRGPEGAHAALVLLARATQGASASTRLNTNRANTAWREDQCASLDWAPSAAGPLHRYLVETVDRLLVTDSSRLRSDQQISKDAH